MSLESSKRNKCKIWEQCDAFRMIPGRQLTLGESPKSHLKIYWLLEGLKQASYRKGILRVQDESKWRGALKAQKMTMGSKEIEEEVEEEVVERCRVRFGKLRSARRVTVFWCFGGTKYLSEIGASEGVKFTDGFLHYSQRHFGVLFLRCFVCCGSPVFPLYPSAATCE